MAGTRKALDRAYAVIMAGGRGERFWPLSTSKRPKQMLCLVGDKPLMAMSAERMAGLVPPERVIVVTGADLAAAAAAAAPGLPCTNIVGEPFGRDTAAACALGTALVRKRDPEGIVCILTADHIIKDAPRFREILAAAIGVAGAGDRLVTIGVEPAYPSTGFGYIEAGERVAAPGNVPFFRAKRFVEKPDRATAGKYLAAGSYCWNSGMFVWSCGLFLEELKKHRPPLARMVDAVTPAIGTPDFDRVLEAEYGKLERISVDYAIMEKTDRMVMARGAFGWDDVGSWPALQNHLDRDADGNVVTGKCEALDSSGNVVVSKERLTALIGVKDLVVVQAPGATLICRKDRAEEVKEMVKRLGAKPEYRDLL